MKLVIWPSGAAKTSLTEKVRLASPKKTALKLIGKGLGTNGIIFGMSMFDALQSVHAPQLNNFWNEVLR
jgi:hypothetical protein